MAWLPDEYKTTPGNGWRLPGSFWRFVLSGSRLTQPRTPRNTQAGYPAGIPSALRRQIEDARARELAGETVLPIVAGYIGPDGRRKRLVYLPGRFWPDNDPPLFQPGGAA